MARILDVTPLIAGWQAPVNDALDKAVVAAAVSAGRAGTLRNAMAAAVDALQAMNTARERMFELRQDPSRTMGYVVQQGDRLREQAYSAAVDALDALQQAADDVWSALAAAYMPKKPAGVSDVLIVDRKHDLERVLQVEASDAPHMAEQAAQLAKDALAAGDTLTAYVLAGGPMDLFYRSVGVTTDMTAAVFAEALGKKEGDLAAILADGGANTLRGIISTARGEAESKRQAMQQFIDDVAAAYAGQLGALPSQGGQRGRRS